MSKSVDTHLRPNFKHVLEAHTSARQFALQQHHHIGIVFVYLLATSSFRILCVALLQVRLEGRDLSVDIGNVLFDDKSEFLQSAE